MFPTKFQFIWLMGFRGRQQITDAKSPHCLWQGELKRILKCEYLHVMYSKNMLHYISIS